ncbi:Holliday junction branch migration protein RuvA [Kaarinaea lacus]
MIGRLHGKLLLKQAPSLLVDVGGVGYELEAPMTTFYQLPEVGNEVILHTHLLVREDAHLLYGFASEQERLMFRSLIKVSGVGAKLALALLSGMAAQEFAQTVQHNDIARLTRVPGVGKKTAERLIVEMRDRLPALGLEGANREAMTPASENAGMGHSDAVKDAISALIALGYKPQEASRMVNAVDSSDKPSEDIIRQALKSVAQ